MKTLVNINNIFIIYRNIQFGSFKSVFIFFSVYCFVPCIFGHVHHPLPNLILWRLLQARGIIFSNHEVQLALKRSVSTLNSVFRFLMTNHVTQNEQTAHIPHPTQQIALPSPNVVYRSFAQVAWCSGAKVDIVSFLIS